MEANVEERVDGWKAWCTGVAGGAAVVGAQWLPEMSNFVSSLNDSVNPLDSLGEMGPVFFNQPVGRMRFRHTSKVPKIEDIREEEEELDDGEEIFEQPRFNPYVKPDTSARYGYLRPANVHCIRPSYKHNLEVDEEANDEEVAAPQPPPRRPTAATSGDDEDREARMKRYDYLRPKTGGEARSGDLRWDVQKRDWVETEGPGKVKLANRFGSVVRKPALQPYRSRGWSADSVARGKADSRYQPAPASSYETSPRHTVGIRQRSQGSWRRPVGKPLRNQGA